MKSVPSQQIRFAAAPAGATVVRAAGSPGQQGKQIIIQKPGQQILHVVKTPQGMVTVPKIVPRKTVTTAGTKPLEQGQTINRFVNPNNSKLFKSNLVAVSRIPNTTGKQTIVLAKPGGGVVNANRLVLVTAPGGTRTVQGVTTSQAGVGQTVNVTRPMNILPLSAANHVGANQQTVKMIVVSSGATVGGTTGKPLTITVPGQGGIAKT